MPDSFLPPPWGPPPIDERDLDALLSGDMFDVPPQLRQVADALTALRAAPTFAELSGEATIMAEFRALAEFRAYGMSAAARPGGMAHTLELPALPSGLAPRRRARHRSHRRTGRLLTRPMAALTAAAAAAVVVAAIAVAGVLPGHHPGTSPSSAVSGTTASASGGALPAAQSASPDPTRTHTTRPTPTVTPTPTQAPPTSNVGKLCVDYFSSLGHAWSRSRWASEVGLYTELSKLAGGGDLYHLYKLCGPYFGDRFHHGSAGSSQYPQHPRAGTQGASGQGGSDPGQPGSSPQPTAPPSQPANGQPGNSQPTASTGPGL